MRLTHYLLLYKYERMKFFLLALHLMFLLDSVSTSLPAPVNVSLISVNFHHVLRWDPGPGTPPGTQYKIFKRENSGKKEKQLNSSKTSLRLKLDKYKTHFLTVQASYNQTLSPKSDKVSFEPFQDTKISAPKLSLAGCGDCIKINISLHKTVQEIYTSMKFKVWWRKANKPLGDYKQVIVSTKSYTLKNLERGQQYCVQVHSEITLNKNTEPSAWKCTFTSIVEPRKVNVILGVAAVLGVLAIGALMSFMFCLHYTGFLCKLKALPRALTMTLIKGRTLILDVTIPDPVSIYSETDRQNKCKNPTVPHPHTRASGEAEEEEKEEEEEQDDDDDEEEKKAYVDRNAGLSSSESSRQDSRDVSGNSTLPASVRLSTEVEEADEKFDHEELDQYEAKDEGAEVSFMPEGGQTEVQGHVTDEEEEEEEKEEVCHSPGNINLFSVTLAALPVSEEEEGEENDFLKLSDLEPLLPTDSKRTLSYTDSQTDSDDQTPAALMQPTPEDVNETGYESRHAHSLSACLQATDGETQEEEEEEEEEFSGYMGRT